MVGWVFVCPLVLSLRSACVHGRRALSDSEAGRRSRTIAASDSAPAQSNRVDSADSIRPAARRRLLHLPSISCFPLFFWLSKEERDCYLQLNPKAFPPFALHCSLPLFFSLSLFLKLLCSFGQTIVSIPYIYIRSICFSYFRASV